MITHLEVDAQRTRCGKHVSLTAEDVLGRIALTTKFAEVTCPQCIIDYKQSLPVHRLDLSYFAGSADWCDGDDEEARGHRIRRGRGR